MSTNSVTDESVTASRHRMLRLADYAARFPTRTCANCRQRFVAGRSDAITCSPRCRMARSRKPPLDLISADEASALLEGQHYLGALEFDPRYCLTTLTRCRRSLQK